MLKTRQKIALASWASRAIGAARGILGLGDTAVVRRRGVRWRLELSEGIDFSIFLLGAFEPRLVDVHRKLVRPGETVIDVGANVGAHALHFAKFAGPRGTVLAVEPTQWAFRKLLGNIELNPSLSSGLRARQVELVASPGSPGTRELYSSWPLFPAKHPSVHDEHGGRLMPLEQARALTLDELVESEKLERVDLIKIDVDGREWSVLQGARATLSRHRPRMILELAPYLHAREAGRDDFSAMIGFLRGSGYALSEAESGRALPTDPDVLRRQVPAGASINALATPRDAPARPR